MKISQIISGVLAVPLVGIGLVVAYLVLRPGGFDPMQPMREQRVKERQELMKKHAPPPRQEPTIVT